MRLQSGNLLGPYTVTAECEGGMTADRGWTQWR